MTKIVCVLIEYDTAKLDSVKKLSTGGYGFSIIAEHNYGGRIS